MFPIPSVKSLFSLPAPQEHPHSQNYITPSAILASQQYSNTADNTKMYIQSQDFTNALCCSTVFINLTSQPSSQPHNNARKMDTCLRKLLLLHKLAMLQARYRGTVKSSMWPQCYKRL